MQLELGFDRFGNAARRLRRPGNNRPIDVDDDVGAPGEVKRLNDTPRLYDLLDRSSWRSGRKAPGKPLNDVLFSLRQCFVQR
ncbi:MAG: hypothetical protein AB7P33_16485 [Dehalococcoidia bacterium]